MKLSLFTPTHRPIHLSEAYASLLRQTAPVAWEWIIVPNNGIKRSDVPEAILSDSRVRVIQADTIKGIGALKNFAAHQCSGDILIELDHDDILASNTFEELVNAHETEPDGFYYSDFINVRPNGTCETYNTKFGWEIYDCVVDGKNYKAVSAMPATARGLSQVYYAPNHIRAWSRKAYMQVKGHDVNLAVADDHDLLCRTYIAGTPFVHIKKPLYIYRRHDGNSFVALNKDIQTLQTDNMNKYMYPLVAAETKQRKLRALDVGRQVSCGKNLESIDLVANGFNFAGISDNSVNCIRAHDFLHRVPRKNIVTVMNQFYRILAPGGWLLTATPSIDDGEGHPGRGVFQDPTHQSYWSQNNFWYYTDRKYASLVDGLSVRFQLVRCWTAYPSPWHRSNVIPYVYADLCALKGQRQPGETKI